MAGPAIADADTFVVNDNNVAISDGDCATTPSGCRLSDAIDEANSLAGRDVITFASSVTGTITAVVDLPTVTDNLTINGPGRDVLALSGGDGNQILRIDPFVRTRIDRLTLRDGRSDVPPERGAGIYAGDGASLTITNSAFTDNEAIKLPPSTANPRGGAIYAGRRSDLEISDTVFSGNLVDGSPDATSYGGAIATRGDLEITGSTFDGNIATSGGGPGVRGYGGGIFKRDLEDGEVSITDSTFSANEAGGEGGTGGGMFIYADELTITNSTISGNTATSRGGGAVISAGGLIDSSTVANNSAGDFGGGLYGVPGQAAGSGGLLNTVVADNTTSTGTGGDDVYGFAAIANYSLIEDSDASVLELSGSNNVLGVDPGLGPLAANGGPAQTQAITVTSPAFGAGATGLADDQRGVLRPQGGTDDIGAFELSVGPRTTLTSAPSGTIVDSTPEIRFSSSDPDVARFECSIDGGAYFTCTSPFTLPEQALGAHRIEVRAVDADGQTGEPAVATFTLGTLASDDPPGDPSAKSVEDADVSADKKQKQGGKKVKIKIKAGAAEPVNIVAKGRITVKGGKKGKNRVTTAAKNFKLAKVKKSADAGEQVVLRLTPKKKKDSKKIFRLLRRGKDLRANPSVKMTDDAGNSVVEKRVVRLKAQKK